VGKQFKGFRQKKSLKSGAMNSSSNATKSPSAGSLSLEFIRELHVIAFSCCLCSVVASCSVIVLSFVMKGYRVPLRKKPMMDRLVIYLAIGDIFFTASHGIDHIILYANNETTNFFVCKICAFFFHWGLDASCMIASFVAVSAFIGVVLGKK
uniref:G_PROTEIN_RECEP_F1_2 domain-containing protein n=1 Tax=Macrostomum lignano TaxID=282301 RepID=A0A1I8J2H3_9PLAT